VTRQVLHVLREYRAVDEMVRVLAYAEMRSVMLAWARVPIRQPVALVRWAVDRAMPMGAAPWLGGESSFAAHCRQTIQQETSALFRAIARTRGPHPWQLPVAPGQVGDIDGLDAIFHAGAVAAGDVRIGDPRLTSLAYMLVDFVRQRALDELTTHGARS
jgi:hypothetical protein